MDVTHFELQRLIFIEIYIIEIISARGLFKSENKVSDDIMISVQTT